MTKTYTGTDADNAWTVVQAATFTLDGLGGVDTIHFGTSLRSAYTIVANDDGSVSVDSVSSASAALHATLRNVEQLTFNSGADKLDLTTHFGDRTAPALLQASPADGAALVDVHSNLRFTFSEPVKLGSGSMVLKDSSGAIVEQFSSAASAALSIDGSTITVNPTARLASASSYVLQIAPDAVLDLAGNALRSALASAFSTAPPKALNGGVGNDLLTAGAGDEVVDGGAGTDTLVYAHARAGVTIARTAQGVSVSAPTGDGGVDLLVGVERLVFADAAVALDIDGNGGQAYRLYQAAFNRTPDAGGLGYWISRMDLGTSLDDVAGGFVSSPEFIGLVGANPDHATLVLHFYQNVLHRAPDAAGQAYWIRVLDEKLTTPAAVLADFSESPENQAALIGTIGNGFEFIPYAG